jgi:hypothetical protein
MPYYITKTGLEAFDTARAWGLVVLLNILTRDEVSIHDTEWAFIVEPLASIPPHTSLQANTQWKTLFVSAGTFWAQVFITTREKRKLQNKVSQVQQVLRGQWQTVLNQLANPANIPTLGSGENIPGGLDPTAFKGLRHVSRAGYKESQLSAPEDHWALACLGMATCGTYHRVREAGRLKTLALLPVPQSTRFSYFRDVQFLLRPPKRHYRGVQNAAAHYAVHLAKQLRQRASAQGSLQDRFHAILYFTLFGAGQQTKPSQGSQLNLAALMEMIWHDLHGSQAVFEWLDYCLRVGSADGAAELALAVTELVMRWDFEAYDLLVRTLARVLWREQVQRRNPRDFRQLLWATKNEAVFRQIMGVMNYAVT